VYEAPDILNLGHWESSVCSGNDVLLKHQFCILPLHALTCLQSFEPGVGAVSALAWSTSPFDATMMVVCGARTAVQVSSQFLELHVFPC
jgi:hypothetical protein